MRPILLGLAIVLTIAVAGFLLGLFGFEVVLAVVYLVIVFAPGLIAIRLSEVGRIGGPRGHRVWE